MEVIGEIVLGEMGGLVGGEAVEDFGEGAEGGVDFFDGGFVSEREADGGLSEVLGDAHGEEDMGGEDGADHASGAAGGADAGEVEADEEAFAVKIGEADIERIGEGMLGGSIANGARVKGLDAVPETIAKDCLAGAFGVHGIEGEVDGVSEADDGGGIFRSWSASIFVGAAVLEGVDGLPCFEVEKSRAFGAVKLVSGDGKGIEVLSIEGIFAEGLDGIAMEENSFGAAEGGDFGDGLDGAGFVVGGHDGNERGGGRAGIGEGVEIDETVAIDIEVGNIESLIFL